MKIELLIAVVFCLFTIILIGVQVYSNTGVKSELGLALLVAGLWIRVIFLEGKND